jgi:hypothetical protein
LIGKNFSYLALFQRLSHNQQAAYAASSGIELYSSMRDVANFEAWRLQRWMAIFPYLSTSLALHDMLYSGIYPIL